MVLRRTEAAPERTRTGVIISRFEGIFFLVSFKRPGDRRRARGGGEIPAGGTSGGPAREPWGAMRGACRGRQFRWTGRSCTGCVRGENRRPSHRVRTTLSSKAG